jgi:ABC-2 type transport system ATP-binding protein
MTAVVTADLRGVWKRYFRSAGWVLRGVDLRIEPASLTVVLGGNGDGKSTLLRIVAGACAVSKGQVRRPQGSVSYVPERFPGDLRMSAEHYLKHMARLRGRQAGPTATRSMELLELLQVSPGPDVPIAQLSKGNRQKVSLAQAFGFPARLTVLDEPFSGLDEAANDQLRSLIADTRTDGRSVLISAHHPAALTDCDTFHRLDGGTLRALARSAINDPRSVRRRPGRLVLRAVAATSSSALLAALPDVRSVDDDPATGQVVVITDDPDAVLRSALNSGWSFVQGDPQVVDPEETQ